MQFPRRALRLIVLAPLLVGLVACEPDPTGTYVAADKFDRVVANGWGSSDIGDRYTYAGNATFGVDQEGQATLARGALAEATVGMPATRDLDASAFLRTSRRATGGGQTFLLMSRGTSTGTSGYAASLRLGNDNGYYLSITRATGPLQSTTLAGELPLAGLRQSDWPLVVRTRVTGANPTVISAKAWPAGQPEPGWQLTATDSSGNQGAGSFSLGFAVANDAETTPVTFKVDNLEVKPATASPTTTSTTTSPTSSSTTTTSTSTTVPGPPPPPNTTFGAKNLGATAYPFPADAKFVAPGGSDTFAGTQSAPWATLGHAIRSSPDNSTIVVRGGEYREGGVYITNRRDLTIQSYPGESVWFTGSDPVSGFVPETTAAGTIWRKDNFVSNLPTPDSDNPDLLNLVSPAYPMALSPEMVFFNGSELTQVGSKNEVAPGKFFVDAAAQALYVDGDPTSVNVEAAVRSYALTIDASDGIVVRGIGFHHYGTFVTNVAAVRMSGTNETLENNWFVDNAASGASIIRSTDAIVGHNTMLHNGQIGLHADSANSPLVQNNALIQNNSEHFNASAAAGGLKFTNTKGAMIKDNLLQENLGHGIWLDVQSDDAVLVGNLCILNLSSGVFFEFSTNAIIADNVTVGSYFGILSSRSSTVDIWNNTVANAMYGGILIGHSNEDQGHATIRNNVVSGKSQMISITDGTKTMTGGGLDIHSNNDAFYRPVPPTTDCNHAISGCWGVWPNYPAWELHANSFAEYKQYSGDETSGLSDTTSSSDPFIADVAAGQYGRPAGSPAIGTGAALSAGVATVLGRPTGQIVDIGYLG